MKLAINDRLKSSISISWRLFNHCNKTTDASPSTLVNIFRTYMLSKLEYGSALWIFTIKPDILRDYEQINWGYITLWRKVNAFYNHCIRSIYGLKSKTYSRSTLVISGITMYQANWLPLRPKKSH